MAIFNMNSDDTIMQAIHAINQSINQLRKKVIARSDRYIQWAGIPCC